MSDRSVFSHAHPIEDVVEFLVAVDQKVEVFDARQLGLYIGLQLEEMAEKMEAVFGAEGTLTQTLHAVGNDFKRGAFDSRIANLPLEDRVKMLDADLDQVWVSLGAALSLGAKVGEAWGLLVANNMAKIDPSTGKARRDADGKITKPEGHQPPDFGGCFI